MGKETNRKEMLIQTLFILCGVLGISIVSASMGYPDLIPVFVIIGVASLVISPIERVDTVDRGQMSDDFCIVTIAVVTIVGILVYGEFGPQALIFIGILFVVGYVVNEYRKRYNKVGEVNGE